MSAVETYSSIKKALEKSERSFSDLSVVAVSKKQSVDRIKAFLELGLDFEALGESFLQELQEKKQSLAGAALTPNFHFIGRLQSRKITDICELVSCIHSVGRSKEWEIIREWNEQAGPQARVGYYLQINVSGEESKNGITPAALKKWKINELNADANFCGLMAMPEPLDEVGKDKVREQIVLLRNLRDEYFPSKKINVGTTHDFEVAIEEGTQVIRLGSSLFGPR